jgi:hypothetical protein
MTRSPSHAVLATIVPAGLAAVIAIVPAAADLPAAEGSPAVQGQAFPNPRLPAAGPPKLSLPIACVPGETCFIQSEVDLDPGPGARDYRCGSATYDGHKGVDFRLRSAAAARQGVAVLAAADGVVKRMRDGMEDVFVTAATRAEVTRRGCGNSVLVDHGGGWQTVYCHMRKGSLAVRPGAHVSRGQRMGDVGYSGLAEFAHVHFMVMHDGAIVDPESGLRVGETCLSANAAAPPGTLWDEAAAKAFAYRNGEFIGAGFSARQLSPDELETDHSVVPPTPASDALLFYARLINLRAGDRIGLSVSGPGGFAITHASQPLERNKATYVAFAGRPLRASRWPSGNYEGQAELIRNGQVIARSPVARLTLP